LRRVTISWYLENGRRGKMRIVVRPDLTAILTKEIGPKSGLVVVEKLAGTTPKSAIMFLLAYPNIRYRVFNLADSSAVYFERAEELCPEFGIDFGWFRDRVEYCRRRWAKRGWMRLSTGGRP